MLIVTGTSSLLVKKKYLRIMQFRSKKLLPVYVMLLQIRLNLLYFHSILFQHLKFEMQWFNRTSNNSNLKMFLIIIKVICMNA